MAKSIELPAWVYTEQLEEWLLYQAFSSLWQEQLRLRFAMT